MPQKEQVEVDVRKLTISNSTEQRRVDVPKIEPGNRR